MTVPAGIAINSSKASAARMLTPASPPPLGTRPDALGRALVISARRTRRARTKTYPLTAKSSRRRQAICQRGKPIRQQIWRPPQLRYAMTGRIGAREPAVAFETPNTDAPALVPAILTADTEGRASCSDRPSASDPANREVRRKILRNDDQPSIYYQAWNRRPEGYRRRSFDSGYLNPANTPKRNPPLTRKGHQASPTRRPPARLDHLATGDEAANNPDISDNHS